MAGWRILLVVTFLIFYVGFGMFSFGIDVIKHRAEPSDFFKYFTFSKFADYEHAYEIRATDFYTSTGVLRSDALLSMFILAMAQLSFIMLLSTMAWVIIPSDSPILAGLTFLLVIGFVSVLNYYATGSALLSIFKVLGWAIHGAPAGLNQTANATINATINLTNSTGGV